MSTMDEVVNGWLRHRLVLHDLLERVDDEHVNFKPWDNAMSLGELAIHMASAMDMFVKSVKNMKFTPSDVPKEFSSISDVREIVKNATANTRTEMKYLNKIQINGDISLFNDKAPGSYWLSNAIDHEVHHKGQLFTYVRMVGVEDVPHFMKHPNEVE